MKWGLKIFLKYIHPSVALRDSRLRSPSYISASPTSRFFSAGPCFVSSSTVRPNQSSINSSYLNQDVGPLKRGGFFVLIPRPAYIVLSTLRDMLQPVILLISFFCFLMGSHQRLPHSHSSLGLLKLSCNTHSRGTLFATRSSAFTTQQPRSAATLWLLVCYFCGNLT